MATLKQLRKTKNSLSKLQDTVSNKSYKKEDTRFWQATRDKQGNASTVIRFLPQANLEASPFAKSFNHFFQGKTGKYFVEPCPTTHGDPCPVCETNDPYWKQANGERDGVPEEIQERGRSVKYVANILVIKDPANPENEGQVRLFKFGPAIFNFIKEALNPKFDDEVAINPFDIEEGANFNFKIYKDNNRATYKKSSWGDSSILLEDDEDKLEEVIESLYDLEEFYHKDETKTYDELMEKLATVTGENFINETTNTEEPEEVVEDVLNESVSSKTTEEFDPSEFDNLFPDD